jgi:DNA-directed RNA polymerase specialized sigma24 family protein
VHLIAVPDHASAPRSPEPLPPSVPRVADAELVARLRNGDMSALEIIYGRYARSVFQRCWRALREREAAWEATQQTFIAFLVHLPCLGEESARDWLLRAAPRITADISAQMRRL